MNRKQKQNKKSGEQTLPTRAFIPLLPMLLARSKCQQATNICPALDNLKFRPCGGNYVLLVLRFVFFFFFGFYQGGLTIHGSGSAPELVRSFPLLVLPSSFSWAPATSCTKKTATRQRGQNESVLGVKFVSFRCDSWYLFLGNKKYCSSLKTFL